jgi:hypothetical protein
MIPLHLVIRVEEHYAVACILSARSSHPTVRGIRASADSEVKHNGYRASRFDTLPRRRRNDPRDGHLAYQRVQRVSRTHSNLLKSLVPEPRLELGRGFPQRIFGQHEAGAGASCCNFAVLMPPVSCERRRLLRDTKRRIRAPAETCSGRGRSGFCKYHCQPSFAPEQRRCRRL